MAERAAHASKSAIAVGALTAASCAVNGAADPHALANALAELMRRGVVETEPKRVLSLLAEVACRLTGADYSVVVSRGGITDLSSFAGYGVRSAVWNNPWSMVPNSATSIALGSGQTLVVRGLQDKRQHRQVRYLRHRAEGAQTVLVAPLPSRESLNAVLHVGWREPVDPVPEQVQLIETLAAYGGIILDNAHSRERLETEISARHELLRRAYDAVPYAVYMVDVHGRVAYANLAAAQFVGEGDLAWTRAQRQGARLETEDGCPLSLDDTPSLLALRTGQPQRQRIIRFFHPDGAPTLTMRFDSTPLFDPDGNLDFVVTSAIDMTDIVEARAALESSERQMQELSRKLVEQQDNERRSLSLELHDEVGQLVTAARYILESARRLPPDQKDQKLQEAQQVLADVISEIRALSLSLRPPMLDELGLVPALEWHVEHVRGQTGLRIDVHSALPSIRLHPDVEGAAFRIVQESLTNVMRYAPDAPVQVEVRQDGDWLCVNVEDLGPGFDVANTRHRATMGLAGMRYRAENLGGAFEIASHPGAGTRVTAKLPFLPAVSSSPDARSAVRKVAAARR